MDYEHDLLARLEADNPNRAIGVLDGSQWGHLILPGADEHPKKNDRGLKVLVIGSWTLGMLAFEAIREVERAEPDRMNIIGLVTDDPLDPPLTLGYPWPNGFGDIMASRARKHMSWICLRKRSRLACRAIRAQ